MRLWTAIKTGIFVGLTVTMMWHWQVVEAEAEPMAIIATDSVAAPAENIFFAAPLTELLIAIPVLILVFRPMKFPEEV